MIVYTLKSCIAVEGASASVKANPEHKKACLQYSLVRASACASWAIQLVGGITLCERFLSLLPSKGYAAPAVPSSDPASAAAPFCCHVSLAVCLCS